MWQIWLILAGIFLIIEIINFGFLIFWFSVGALVAMVVSLFVENVVAQTTVFLVISTLLLFLTKPLVNKVLPKESKIKTNASRVEGKIGKVTTDIDPIDETGQVKVGTEIWSAKSFNKTYIPKNTEVLIEKIDGVKVIVKPIQK